MMIKLSPVSRIGVFSRGILRIKYLDVLLGHKPCRARETPLSILSAIAGWGLRPSSRSARLFAEKHRLPYLSLEDGFLRSWGTGDRYSPLSIVIDGVGIYYDGTRPSAIEMLLNSEADLLAGIEDDVRRAKALILGHRLSKYNHAPGLNAGVLRDNDRKRVLVIDQTAGDMSISLGLAGAKTFAEMLAFARDENTDATIYVKTHPEVTSGRKQGHFHHLGNDERTVVLRDAINPITLIGEMDRVYCVSSTMGFEALLAGKPVTCLGMPWYAGWGVTDDRQACPRRTRRREVDELFAAAYFHYTRYLDPVTLKRGTIFDVIDWLVHQQVMDDEYPGRMICFGFRRWKAANLKPILSLNANNVKFVRDLNAIEQLDPDVEDALVVWGQHMPLELQSLVRRDGLRLLRMEDGIVRSVGLGSDLIRPLSVVLDARGIYFDPSQPSDLEHLLNTEMFSADELSRARWVREYIVEHRITKYNIEAHQKTLWHSKGRAVVLVPGQVEDDASIRLGCTIIKTNLGLLQAVREARPDAFIVYKPHPDVTSGNRAGKLAMADARRWADHVETGVSVVSCIESCDEVHTMTSLTGFDALLRGRQVVTYGQPFYAGWGLTDDRMKTGEAFVRRQRILSIDELAAGALLRYPIYWDWDLKGYTSCEGVLYRIIEMRDSLERSGRLDKLRFGFVGRQWRKISILLTSTIKH